MLKRIVAFLYVTVIACMAIATFAEKYRGTDFIHSAVYGSWWFVTLWAALAIMGTAYFLRRKIRRGSIVILHLSLVIILLGASLTYLTGWRGAIKLRLKADVDTYYIMDSRGEVSEHKLPFKLRLEQFHVRYHEGTEAEADYESVFTIIEEGQETKASVSMNNIFKYKGIRFYQMSYDHDKRGSVLAMNSDPWGIPVTYTGYGLLFLSLVWMVLDPRGTFRQLLRSDLVRKGALTALAIFACVPAAQAVKVLPRETAGKFGSLYIMYNNRICPVETFAIDFTKKLCGKTSYQGYTAEQVLTGFLFYSEEWTREPIVAVKGKELREALSLPRRCAVNDFFNYERGGYILGPYIQQYYSGQQDKAPRQAADLDGRLMMVMDLSRGKPLKMFPVNAGKNVAWYAPTDNVPDSLAPGEERAFIANVLTLFRHEVEQGDIARANQILDKILKYQRQGGGSTLPSETRWQAERLYNCIPFATLLFMFNLGVGLFLFVLTLWGMSRGSHSPRLLYRPFLGWTLLSLPFLALTLCLGLRWTVSGRVPMANGYETMLTMAWFVMALSLVAYSRFRMALPFGLMMSGFFLLVSHINQMDPQIGHVMPVLSSPLLSLHVSVIMMGFALLSLTFVCGVTVLLVHGMKGKRGKEGLGQQLGSLTILSRLMLYPALALLAIGIFVGAIWANISWGTYWSWDAKETWGLITLMVYAVAAHQGSLPFLRHPVGYHLFMTLAFLSIVMTYFGVNYFLGGMHSYA